MKTNTNTRRESSESILDKLKNREAIHCIEASVRQYKSGDESLAQNAYSTLAEHFTQEEIGRITAALFYHSSSISNFKKMLLIDLQD